MTLLRGWKEIEGYLRMKRRALVRQGIGAVLSKSGTGKSATVYASTSDLDRWLRRNMPKKAVKGP